jgi:hypothetical protein
VRVLALLEPDVRAQLGQRRVQLGVGRAGDAVRRPRVHEVGVLAEVLTRIDVPVLRGHHGGVPVAVGRGVDRDPVGYLVRTLGGELATLAERGLDVDHDERPPLTPDLADTHAPTLPPRFQRRGRWVTGSSSHDRHLGVPIT